MISELKGLRISTRENTNDFEVAKEVIKKDVYQKHFKITKDDIILDVGGHIGCFTLLALKNGAKVITYEPEKENYNIILDNLGLNGFGCIVVNKGISNSNREEKLYLNKKTNKGSHSFHINKRRKDFSIVQTKDINDIINKFNYLKLDCEGEEYNIIMSIKDFSGLKKVVFEAHFNILGRGKVMNMVEKLEKEGFKSYYNKKYFEKNYWFGIFYFEKVGV